MLAPPLQLEILPLQIWNKVWACLATWFNVQLNIVKSVIKLDQPITQYGRVSRLEGGDFMLGRHFVKAAGDSQDASFVRVGLAFLSIYANSHHLQYTQLVDRHAHNCRKTPDFELQNFFGQLCRILLLEIPSAQRLNLGELTTVILALIREVKATLREGIY